MSTLILCRSLTAAQRAQRLLERSGLPSSLQKAPTNLTRNGCGYALRLRRSPEEAVELLRRADLLSGRVYEEENGRYKELFL